MSTTTTFTDTTVSSDTTTRTNTDYVTDTTSDAAATSGAATASGEATASEGAVSRCERKLAEARAVLERGLADVREDSEALAAYLRFRARFRDYSVQNALLISLQRPTARFCMGYRAWQRHGRQVRRGERGLMIYAPILRRPTEAEIEEGADPERRLVAGFRVTHTFDYGQTDPVRDDALTYASPVARLDEDGCDEIAGRLAGVAASLGYSIVEAEPGAPKIGYADGTCSFRHRTIALVAGLSSADRAAVLAHELAHALAHHSCLTACDDGGPSVRAEGRRLDATQRELQAEGAAYVALYALGLDTSRVSLPYLKGWAGDDQALLAELGAIDRIAADLLDRLD